MLSEVVTDAGLGQLSCESLLERGLTHGGPP